LSLELLGIIGALLFFLFLVPVSFGEVIAQRIHCYYSNIDFVMQGYAVNPKIVNFSMTCNTQNSLISQYLSTTII
jgi:hypothetical protein